MIAYLILLLALQIEMRDTFAPAEPIEASVSVPGVDLSKTDHQIVWSTDDAVALLELPGQDYSVHLWPLTGEHKLSATIAYIADGKPKLYTDSHVFKMLSANVPPGPGPAPISTLRELVGDSTQCKDLSVIYSALASALRSGAISTRAEFDYVHEARLAARNLDKHKARSAIDLRLAQKSFDAQALAVIIGEIITDLSPLVPTPPLPIPDPIPEPVETEPVASLMLIRESGDDTNEFASLVRRLRANSPEFEYLQSRGLSGKMLILDDDDSNSPDALKTLNPIPELYLLDNQGGVVAHLDIDLTSEDGTPATTAADVVNFLRGYQ